MHSDARWSLVLSPTFFKLAKSEPAEGKCQSFNGALKEAVNNQSPLAVPSAARLVTPVLCKSWKRSRMENGPGGVKLQVPTTLKDRKIIKVEKCPLKAWSDTLFREKDVWKPQPHVKEVYLANRFAAFASVLFQRHPHTPLKIIGRKEHKIHPIENQIIFQTPILGRVYASEEGCF